MHNLFKGAWGSYFGLSCKVLLRIPCDISTTDLHVSCSHTAGTRFIPTRCSSVTTRWSGSRVWTGPKRLWVNTLFFFYNIQTELLSLSSCMFLLPSVFQGFCYNGGKSLWVKYTVRTLPFSFSYEKHCNMKRLQHVRQNMLKWKYFTSRKLKLNVL